jgi:hypothetical protein
VTTDHYDLGALAYGIDRIERARKTIEHRRHAWNAKPGWNWKPGEAGMEHPKVVGPAAQAVLDYSDDGQRYQVNGYTHDGHHLYRREFATLDAALRNGDRVARTGPTQAERVEAWNLTYPVSQAIRYWTGAREGAGRTGRTRTAATLLEGHTAVVWVTGHAACVALTHVDPIPESEADS